MKVKSFVIGLVVGLVVAAATKTWLLRTQVRCVACAQAAADKRLRLVEYTEQTGNPETLSLLRELTQLERLYVLQCDGRDVGGVALSTEGVEEVYLMSPSAEHTVTVGSVEGRFPGEISVAANQAGGCEGIWTVQDLDLDGIPDRRMDWEAKQLFDLDSIKWQPRPEQEPSTSQTTN
jgi:hypothetical protein